MEVARRSPLESRQLNACARPVALRDSKLAGGKLSEHLSPLWECRATCAAVGPRDGRGEFPCI